MVTNQNQSGKPTIKALTNQPVVPQYGEWTAEGDQFFKERRFKEALDCYNRALATEPLNVKAWYNKAQSLVMCLKYTEAIEACNKTLELDPESAPSYFLKSFAHGVLGQYQEALEAANKGLEIDTSNYMIWSTRGQYLYALGRLEEALESFGTALKMNPDNAYCREVINKIKNWLQRSGQSPEWTEKVLAFLKQSGYQDALNTYQESVKVDPRAVSKTFDKDYALAHITNPEKMMRDMENIKAKEQPQIFLELSQKEFEFSREAWVEVMLTNKGKTAAREIVFYFSQDVTLKQLDISPEQVALLKTVGKPVNLDAIPELTPGVKIKKLVSLTPNKIGHISLDVKIDYIDIWGCKQSRSNVIWISVFKPGGQLPPVPGHKLLWRLSSSDASSVYVAQRNADNVRVVIKIPHFSPEQTSLVAEFMNEIKQANKLSHPNIVRIFQFGEQPSPWVSLEYMSKGTLSRRLTTLSISQALKIGILITDALYYGRMNRLAHRWITPDNIFFDDNEIPKLGNWRTSPLTHKLYKNQNLNEIVTVYYPPEKVIGGMGGLDYFSDIYQIGAILFAMLTGKPIFSETGEALIEKIKNGHTHTASLYNPEINRDLDKVISLCLAKNKKDRYQSTAALKSDLLKILASYESARNTT